MGSEETGTDNFPRPLEMPIKIKKEVEDEYSSSADARAINTNFQLSLRILEAEIKKEIKDEPETKDTPPVSPKLSLMDIKSETDSLRPSVSSTPSLKNVRNHNFYRNFVPPHLRHFRNRFWRYDFKYNNKQKSPSAYETRHTRDKLYFVLTVINFPTSWSQVQIKDFVEKQCGRVKKVEMKTDTDMNFIGKVRIEFSTFERCLKAKSILNGKMADGVKLIADISVSNENSDADDDMDSSEPQAKRKKQHHDDACDVDPSGMYGLKPEFLKSLGITPPITQWVHVSNFRCDKSELKEVMEMAGHVAMCLVVFNPAKYANVMYNHPLEAVQAVSMLNDQIFYGQKLKVTIEQYPKGMLFLPKGLQGVGPGLGLHGKPIRDITRQYDRFTRGYGTSINKDIFRTMEVTLSSDVELDDDNDADTQSNAPNSPYSENLDSQLGSNQNLSSINTQSCDIQTTENTAEGNVPSSAPPGQSVTEPNRQSSQNLQSSSKQNTSLGSNNEFQTSSLQTQRIPTLSRQYNSTQNIPTFNNTQSQSCGPQIQGYPRPQMGSPVAQRAFLPMNQQFPQAAPQSVQSMITNRAPGPGSLGPLISPIRPQMNPIAGPIQPPGPNHPLGPQSGPIPQVTGPICPIPPQSGPIYPGPMAMGIRPGIPMPAPSCPGPIAGPIAPAMPGAAVASSEEYIALEISNLPLSTTFPVLSEKMAQCGQVMSLQLIGPGRAVVKYANRSHADMCFKQYNKCQVMNNIIDVKFL